MMKENRFLSALAFFRYHFLQSGKFILFISIVVAIISFINGINGQPAYRYDSSGEFVVWGYDPTLGFSTFVLAFLCYLVPVLQFSFFKKRRNLDYIYSMPISRDELGAVHYVVGFLEIIIPFTASYLTNFLIFASWQSDETKLLPLIWFYFWCLLFAWIFYSIFSFAFNEANNVTDGCVFMIFWSFVFCLVSLRFEILSVSSYFIPFLFLLELQGVYEQYAKGSHSFPIWEAIDEGKNQVIIWFFIIAALGAMIYLLITFGKRRTEKAEEISDSPFGYNSMIPIYAFLISFFDMDLLAGIIIFIATLVGYTIFRRGIKYKVTDLAVMGALLLVCIFSVS